MEMDENQEFHERYKKKQTSSDTFLTREKYWVQYTIEMLCVIFLSSTTGNRLMIYIVVHM